MTKNEPLNLVKLTDDERAFVDQVQKVMESYFAADIGQIVHAHDVKAHADNLLHYIDADPVVTIAAAYLHDIGIPEAERKYGRCDGKLQEQEGPAVARMLLADVGAEEQLIDRVCELVGHHHTPKGVDSPEFRILWDADALVNLAPVVAEKEPYAIDSILNKALVTEAGYRMARGRYLPKKRADEQV